MSNRLPPAWAKHLKPRPSAKATAPDARHSRISPKASLRSVQPKAVPPRSQADDILLRQALELQKAERLSESEELCLKVLTRKQNHPLACYILGTLGIGYDNEKALRYFARAVAEEPQNPYYHLSIGETYLKLSEFTPAIRHFQEALDLKPDLVEALCALGDAYKAFGKSEMALPIFEKALKIARNHPMARIGLPRALASLGRMDEAAVHLKEAIEQRIAVPAAYSAFVHTRRFTEEPPELAAILAELRDPDHGSAGSAELHHAAGKLLNDLRRYKEAMDHFKKGNQARGQKFDLEIYRRWVDAVIETFTPETVAPIAAYGNHSEVPVFVVGMPRSGTTLTVRQKNNITLTTLQIMADGLHMSVAELLSGGKKVPELAHQLDEIAIRKRLAHIIDMERQRRNLLRYEMAELIGVAEATFMKLERANGNISVDTIAAIASALKLNPATFLFSERARPKTDLPV